MLRIVISVFVFCRNSSANTWDYLCIWSQTMTIFHASFISAHRHHPLAKTQLWLHLALLGAPPRNWPSTITVQMSLGRPFDFRDWIATVRPLILRICKSMCTIKRVPGLRFFAAIVIVCSPIGAYQICVCGSRLSASLPEGIT